MEGTAEHLAVERLTMGRVADVLMRDNERPLTSNLAPKRLGRFPPAPTQMLEFNKGRDNRGLY